MSIERLSEAGAAGLLRGASKATGADFAFLLQTAQRESGLDPQARAQGSSAAGLFQFVERTWLALLERYGGAHGAGEAQAQLRSGEPLSQDARRALLDLRFDPALSARLAGELAQENRALLAGALGRAPSGGELYAAHVLGPAGAAKLIAEADKGAPEAAVLFPAAAEANPGLFFQNGAAVSASGLLARLSGEAATIARGAPSAPEEQPSSAQLLAALIASEFLEEGRSRADRALLAQGAYEQSKLP